ncbi:hypothetical protein DV515_00010930 [Chloebia gouldiae]|uniref:Uncharacterized protein n=1 Tax=Chloebia gouldiae TaxID=44316 RepID=A0A3L8S7T0_CHLGU|nr:hypothetical protein DV515_00010930 [Chloebia gouldiae]
MPNSLGKVLLSLFFLVLALSPSGVKAWEMEEEEAEDVSYPAAMGFGFSSHPPRAASLGAFLRVGTSALLSKELKDISNPALPENPGSHLHLPSSCTHIQLLERSDSLPCSNDRH